MALQQLQSIGRVSRAFFLGNGEHLSLERRLAQIEQSLSRHGRIRDLFLLWDEGQHGVHQGRFTRRRCGLYQHGERLGQLTADGRQIGGDQIGALADNAADLGVLCDLSEYVGAFQQGQRVHFFLGRHLVNGFRGRERLLDLRLLQGLQL